METLDFQVINFARYNPRNDRKAHSWLRLQNTILNEPKFFGLSAAQKWGIIGLYGAFSSSRSAAYQGRCDASPWRLHGASPSDETIFATVYVDHFAHQIGISKAEFLALVEHLVRVRILRLWPGEASCNQTVTSGNQAVADGVTTYTVTNTNKDLTKIPKSISEGEAPRNHDPQGDRFKLAKTGLKEIEIRRELQAVYPGGCIGWKRAWRHLQPVLLEDPNRLEDLRLAVKHYREDMIRKKRPAEMISTFANFIVKDDWESYVEPPPVEDFAEPAQPKGQNGMELARRVHELVKTYSPQSSAGATILKNGLSDDPVLYRAVLRLKTDTFRKARNDFDLKSIGARLVEVMAELEQGSAGNRTETAPDGAFPDYEGDEQGWPENGA